MTEILQGHTTLPVFVPSSSGLGLDSFFLVSGGQLSGFNPNGKLLWHVDTPVTWSDINAYPILTTIQILAGDLSSNVHLLAVGDHLALVSLDGNVVASRPLRMTDGSTLFPIAPPTIGDFNNDGLNDVIIMAGNGFYGFTIQQGTGSVLFPMLVVSLIGVMVYILLQGGGMMSSDDERVVRKRAD